ncbi:MAG: radical SAM protein [Clostridia bacterium]|nr:radical SAM protein [Clostridia bacterium]
MNEIELSARLNKDVRNWTREVCSYIFRRPALLPLVSRLVLIQRSSTQKRSAALSDGLHVPPYMILSATKKCNLNCKGCYDKAHGRVGEDMDGSELDKLLHDSGRLGIGVIITAGGEPFARADLPRLMKKHRNLLFVVFTNGLALADSNFVKFIKAVNIYPVISIEGDMECTDSRRGAGMYDKITKAMETLVSMNKAFGLSVTVTTANYNDVLSDSFLAKCRKNGASSVFFIDYVPFISETKSIELNEQQRVDMLGWLSGHKRKDLFTVAFPGDEKPYGGCLAAGKGFLHIAADGSVEPCPFAPVSLDNVSAIGLEQALRSPFLKAVRDNTHLLEDETHGCALFHKKTELESILESVRKTPSDQGR